METESFFNFRMRFFGWMKNPSFLWMRAKTFPVSPIQSLNLNLNKPICYFIRTRSFWDLLVLEKVCETEGMPQPKVYYDKLFEGSASFLYLNKPGLFVVKREKDKAPPSPFFKLIERAQGDHSFDVQFVPVSVFWGRNPGKEERSLFRLLFFDDEHAGSVQKFFIVLAQGRNILCNFGKPLSLKEILAEEPVPEEAAKKICRLLKSDFHKQHTATMGPSLYDRAQVIHTLLQSSPIKKALEEETRKTGVPYEKAEERARKFFDEIAADQTYGILRFFDAVLTRLWQRLFSGIQSFHIENVQQVAQENELVYIPSHRSHFDYLILPHTLHHAGLVPPHIASGINLNFWPVGPLFRRAGAFFLRRSFKGCGRLYPAAFSEYLHFLLTRGHAITFFPEGGRSRTGKLLQPKTGMLGMVLQSYLRDASKPIAIIPTFICYDKVVESRSYLKELYGSGKQKESVQNLVQARKVLKSNYGKVCVSFGTPILLGSFLETYFPGVSTRSPKDDFEGDDHAVVATATHDLAIEVMSGINNAAVLTPVSLVSILLLSTPQKAMAEDDILGLIETTVKLFKALPYHEGVSLPSNDSRAILEEAIKLSYIRRFQHPAGDIIFLEDRASAFLTYNRNNILHLFALPSLIASHFQFSDEVKEKRLSQGVAIFYPFLKHELFLRWKDDDIIPVIKNLTAVFIELGLLIKADKNDALKRPDLTSKEFSQLMVFGRILSRTFERYAVVSSLLSHNIGDSILKHSELDNQCQLMARRISLLYGVNDPEFSDKTLFAGFLDLLGKFRYVEQSADGGHIVITERVKMLADTSEMFLSKDIRDSIRRVVDPPNPSANLKKSRRGKDA